MIDKSLMVTMLTILDERRDVPGGLEEDQLFNEINLRAIHAVTPTLLREHLTFCDDKRWTSWSHSILRARRYRITPAGKNSLQDLKENG